MGEIIFTKMQGTGNDYVYVDCFEQNILNPSALAKRISDRRFGVGSDGLILIKPSEYGDCFMDIYNADGSRGKTCGNGLRCAAFYMFKKLGMLKPRIIIETLSGVRECCVTMIGENKAWVQVDMGMGTVIEKPDFCYWELARRLPKGVFLTGMKVVDVGNLHCVLVLDRYRDMKVQSAEDILKTVNLEELADYLEKCGVFENGINVEICMRDEKQEDFCKKMMTGEVQAWSVRVWERGSKETLSCGSGACAVYMAASKNGASSCVFMKGGRLCVECNAQGHLLLSGEAATVFSGCIF